MSGHRNHIRTLFLTYSQCPVERERLLEHLNTVDEVQQYLIAQELHKDGNKHLHCYVKFKEGLPCSKFTPTLDVDGYHGNYQAARSAKAVIGYCSKDLKYITNLSDAYVENPKAKRAKLAHTIQTTSIKELVATGEIPYQQARNALFVQSILIEPYEHDTVRGIWIYGPPHTGKSHDARNNYPGPIFIKSQNKWWDGYASEPTVLLDDFDCGKPLGHYLKIWSDKWACQGEIKGGTVQLRHQHFIVTSNYSIEEMFSGDEQMIAAVTRRFKIIYKEQPYIV